MLLKQHILIILLGFNLAAFAQAKPKKVSRPEKEKKEKRKTVPENIEVFPKNFLIRPRFVYPTISLSVNSRLSGRGDKFVYLPAMPGVVGLSLKIKKVHISGAIQLPAREELKRTYGTSKFRNINMNIQGRYVQWGLFYRDYKGFYLDNYKTYYPEWNTDSLGYPQKPDLRIIEAGISLGFNFNRSFSMNAAFVQGERQKKSAGSFLLGFTERYQRIDSDTSFVPPSQEKNYPNLNRFKYGNFISTILSLGFGYQIVKGKFHVTPVFMCGSGLQIQSYAQTNRNLLWINIPTYASAKAQVGYNGDHFFTNIIYQLEFTSVPIRESRIRLVNRCFEVGMGLRF